MDNPAALLYTHKFRVQSIPSGITMDIAITPFSSWHIVTIDGKFVMKSLGQAIKIFELLEKEGKNLIAIDLNSTTHVDSSAINLLVGVYKKIKQKNGQLVFFGANEDISGIIGIVGLESTFHFFKTRTHFEESISHKGS
jgi:anti-anti-sigma factor